MLEALRLFAERGYEHTTIEEIAAAAEVSPRTFFRYYPTKADALFGDIDERLGALTAALASRDEPLLATLRRVALAFATDFAEAPVLYTTRARLAFGHPGVAARAAVILGRIEAVVADEAARELRADRETDVRPRLVAAAVTGAIRSTALTWTARGGAGDPRELVNESFDLLERGLRAEFGT